MKKELLSDVELRAWWRPGSGGTYHVRQGTILTPAARDFIREKNIQLCWDEEPSFERMPVDPMPRRGGKVRYRNAVTGGETDTKGENMTHLRGNLLVPKTHPRIAFRGRLDSLMAQVMQVQITALEEGKPALADDLDEVMGLLRNILAAEVKETPLEPVKLLGMDSAQLRYASHHVRESVGIDHPVPNYRMGKLCAALNLLRTQVREAELSAARAFSDGGGVCGREDIMEGLNRLSSGIYILFCREAAGRFERGKQR